MSDALTPLLRALVRELAKETAALVVAELSAAPGHYSAKNPPPGKSRAWALRTLKTVPGARKVGRDWVVSVDDFDAWLTDRASTPTPKAKPSNDVEALAEEAFRAAGLRAIR